MTDDKGDDRVDRARRRGIIEGLRMAAVIVNTARLQHMDIYRFGFGDSIARSINEKIVHHELELHFKEAGK
ncbi:MAG: hypothetical protein IPN65_03970 [Elusimicrobia bacterium]|jgi:hypothetical protein|nr:hypothetical protein [Elusimicrobiota bacterium]MBK9429645.1 hypothetical protein [Elusimicrobiota bacterium]MBK9694951.1 hypothetical protein [Elusimicrobiota bacterium]